jgi:Tol biopolymer transport system component
VTFPAGERRRITNDLNRYQGASMSADAKTLVTVQVESVSNLWVWPAGDLAHGGKEITSGRGRSDGLSGLAWTPDGRLVFGSAASGRLEIWIANADGSDARQLTNDPDPSLQPAVAPDGTFIAFHRFKTGGMDVWRMALDGSDARPITHTGTAFNPVVSADSKTVFFYTPAAGFPITSTVPAEGGDPVKVSDDYFRPTSASPDGTLLLGAGWDPKGRRSAVAIVPAAGGPLTLVPDVPPALPSWTPDGKAIT